MFTLYIEDIHGGQTHEHTFGEGELVIGRSREKCDIVLPADNVSRRHARLYTADNRCYIQDLQSSNGVLVDGVRIRDVRELEGSSRVRIGDYVLYVTGEDVPQSSVPSDYGKFVGGNDTGGQVFTIREAVSLIGRGKDTAVTIIDPSVSRIHSKLTITQAGDYVLQDLKSSNGTYVNDQRIEQTVLSHGDRVRFGNVEFRFEGTDEMAAKAVDRPTAAPPQAVAAPAMQIPPESEWSGTGAVPDPLEQSADVSQALPGGGRRWILLTVVGVLVVAIAAAVTVLLTRGDPEPDPEAVRAIADAIEKVEDKYDRQERLERRRRQEIAADLRIAADLLEDRKWAEAAATLDRVAERAPDHEALAGHRALIEKERPNGALFDAAGEARAKRRFGEALATYAKIPEASLYYGDAQAAIGSIRGQRERILEQANDAYRSRDWEVAFERYTEALQIEPDDPAAEKRLARVKRRLRR